MYMYIDSADVSFNGMKETSGSMQFDTRYKEDILQIDIIYTSR